MKSPDVKELLEDVIHDSSFVEHDLVSRERATSAFRNKKRNAFLRRITLIAASIVILATASYFYYSRPARMELTITKPPQPMQTEGPENVSSNLLTDAQLLAVFPAGSCYLAEADGRKVLVFRDEKIKKRYFVN